MAKKEENINKIIAFLSESPRSKAELLAETGLGPDSWQKYGGYVRERLKLEGKTLKLCKGIYSIEDLEPKKSTQDEVQMRIVPSSSDTVMEVLVLNSLSQKASIKNVMAGKGLMTSREITEDIFVKAIWDESEGFGNDEMNGIRYPYSSIDTVLGVDKTDGGRESYKKGLIQKGIVESFEADTKAQRTYDLTIKAPVYLKLGYEAGCVDFDDLNNALQYGGQGYAFSDVLGDIDNLLSLYIDVDKYDINEYYKKIGISGNKKSKIERFLKKISKIDFKNRVLDIEYKPAHPLIKTKNKTEEYKFAVGLVFYASDKDRLYLLGKKAGASLSDEIIMLNSEKIVGIKESKKKSTIYGTPEFMSAFEEMFSASLDGPFELLVEFDRFSNIETKLKRMTDIRPNAVIKQKPGDPDKILYYEPKVRGIDDAARWIRTFGKSAKVIKPNVLKQKMKDSIYRALAYYEEGQEDE